MRVVLLSYNLPDLTAKAVRKVLEKIEARDLILVHNGSSEKNFLKLQSLFPKIQHHRLMTNRHFSGGANSGLHFAFDQLSNDPSDQLSIDPSDQSAWVLFLTNDCEILEVGEPPTTAGLYAPLIFARSENKIDSIGGGLDPQKMVLSHFKNCEDFQKAKYKYVPGTAFWIHRDVFEKTNGFDETYQTYWEDVDLSLRCQQLQIPVAAAVSTRVLHQIGKTCHKDVHYTTYLFQRNRRRLARKFFSSHYANRFYLAADAIKYSYRYLRLRDWRRLKLLKQALQDQHPS